MEITSVEIPRESWIGKSNVLLGSCFSIYIGEQMKEFCIPTLINPCGTLFNPLSILALLKAMDDTSLVGNSIFFSSIDNEWRSWLADTRLKGITKSACAEEVHHRLSLLREALLQASHLYITLGTNVYYSLTENGVVVTNCQRQPDRIFTERHLDLCSCVKVLEDIVSLVRTYRPGIKIVFTLSPFRYRKYTLTGSQLAKATLRLAIDHVCHSCPNCLYFPAYEIMVDELRDYQWYGPDALHPSSQAVEYIWKKLIASNDEN